MNLLSNPASAMLAATGLAFFSVGAQQRRDVALKLAGPTALGLALVPTPALADQFIEASDGSTIECGLARGELTRIALIEDGFANVSKIASGFPYNDFQVTHEPVRGDIYVSVPPQYASDRISFFATSQAGHVYKFACRLGGNEATQLFITNPALARSGAEEWQAGASPSDNAIRLIEAMASGVPVVNPGGSAFEEMASTTGGGKTVSPLTPESLASAWEELLADPAAARAMGERGRRGVEEHYSVTSMKDGFIALAEGARAKPETTS